MAELFADALKFGGAVMIRRIVGIAHVDDFKAIQDESVRYDPHSIISLLYTDRLCLPCVKATPNQPTSRPQRSVPSKSETSAAERKGSKRILHPSDHTVLPRILRQQSGHSHTITACTARLTHTHVPA